MLLNFHNQFENGMFQSLWWMQDGAPAHKLLAIRQNLEQAFGNRVVALHHDTEWSTRSPDLTLCDFFLQGYLKSKVFFYAPT